jgi:hypothetical protein
MPISYSNGSLVTWPVVSLTTAKFKPLTFSMSSSPYRTLRTCSFSGVCMILLISLLSPQYNWWVIYIYRYVEHFNLLQSILYCNLPISIKYLAVLGLGHTKETGNRNATAISEYCYQPELNTLLNGAAQIEETVLPFPQFALLHSVTCVQLRLITISVKCRTFQAGN